MLEYNGGVYDKKLLILYLVNSKFKMKVDQKVLEAKQKTISTAHTSDIEEIKEHNSKLMESEYGSHEFLSQ